MEVGITSSRLRQAWHGVSKKLAEMDEGDAEEEGVDLHELLQKADLLSLTKAIRKRYDVKYPAEVVPAGQAISPVSRELAKRALVVIARNSPKFSTHQTTTSRTRKKVSTDLDA